MTEYSLVFKKSVTKDLRNIPEKSIQRISKRVELLCSNPRTGGRIKLSGQERYRVRQGGYHIIHEIQEKILS